MGIATAFVKFTNKIFKPVVHPFNLQNNKEKTYGMWQYEKGYDTVKLYMDRFTLEEMFKDKRVLDMGCGAAGKSLYYAKQGAKSVTGVDIVDHYKNEAESLANSLGLEDKFSFVVGSAYELPFEDGSFDTVIMNDFMEHVDNPTLAIKEALRLISKGGRIFINFPPYYHPHGAHLTDAVNMPWIHMFMTESALVSAYKDLVKGLPDEEERISLRISKDENGKEYFGYINKMKIGRFKKILAKLDLTPYYYKEVPLRSFFAPLAKLPLLKEVFVKMCVCVLEK